LNARVTLHEFVILSSTGDSFHGTFTIDVFDPATGTTLLQSVKGFIKATRITAD
jgi:hypothetical protein